MALSCPVNLDVLRLMAEVRDMYTRVADAPEGDFHFHRGPAFAASFLGYDEGALAALPASTTASFAGVANPHIIRPLRVGETVVDIGSGAGTDLLLAAGAVGPTGRAIGVDFTPAMREKAMAAARSLGMAHVEVRLGDARAMPVGDGEVDVVISNGVLNLVPDKEAAFAEVVRVLKPGGRLQLADIVIGAALSEKTRSDVELWAA